ncbi:F-box only protein 8-like isoform X1 [Nicotiana tomentosiformis]|uniref:F-box only protein 8-like isoform X1 n=1 Tax=Nicotiana tomentosiformis TaxID=4098 RepID=UPI0014467639|nr:F-box only protein 8-like isoform X1 [Nicotiana tomentosiformis]
MEVVDEVTAVHFPEEILGDILSRLTVRSLLRFECVSKFWNTLISKPYFNVKHLNHAKNDQNSQKFLICQKCPKDCIFSMYCCPLSSVQLVEDVQKLDCPSNSRPRSESSLDKNGGFAKKRMRENESENEKKEEGMYYNRKDISIDSLGIFVGIVLLNSFFCEILLTSWGFLDQNLNFEFPTIFVGTLK